ncbi:hypothetical protein GY45DRAFT_607027 [Cubamyces sp. BRFM 1775]|nr:hypothetical protein GY45DRAFT_607027 [Cubamyces sp. BRFM 1775]
MPTRSHLWFAITYLGISPAPSRACIDGGAGWHNLTEHMGASDRAYLVKTLGSSSTTLALAQAATTADVRTSSPWRWRPSGRCGHTPHSPAAGCSHIGLIVPHRWRYRATQSRIAAPMRLWVLAQPLCLARESGSVPGKVLKSSSDSLTLRLYDFTGRRDAMASTGASCPSLSIARQS